MRQQAGVPPCNRCNQGSASSERSSVRGVLVREDVQPAAAGLAGVEALCGAHGEGPGVRAGVAARVPLPPHPLMIARGSALRIGSSTPRRLWSPMNQRGTCRRTCRRTSRPEMLLCIASHRLHDVAMTRSHGARCQSGAPIPAFILAIGAAVCSASLAGMQRHCMRFTSAADPPSPHT
jgi:hypothetical protein